MRLHQLTVTAFGPFGGRQRVDFDELGRAGLFLLHGATGAGKTSVLDAVCFALYNAVPGTRQTSGSTLRSDHADPAVRTEVRLDLTVAGRRIEVTRQPPWQRPKKRGTGTTTEKAQSWLREYDAETATWRDLSRSHQEIGAEIESLLGMSREQFCQVVLLPQGDFARFLRADAEARGKLLGRLFDTRRFAAVETHLAERRRALQADVTAGDHQLLAAAHRIQQAAGDAAELPLPDSAPGEPGLAADLAQWAAVARAGARERRTVADCAVTAAESAKAQAQTDLDSVRETHRLQDRYAEARARAVRLDERAGEQRAWQERMERARKAEAVTPALALRAETDTEHQRARRAETAARAQLPASFDGASPSGLTAAARKAVEELGGLESARRAEQRIAGLAERRAEADRQEHADTEALQEAAAWLDGWESSRRTLQERIEHAQDAATRAEHLAGQLQPARERASAAHRRDTLRAQAAEAEAHALAARETAAGAHEQWLHLKERRLQGIAAELAQGLTPGESCAVCGATEHPRPAPLVDGHVGRQAEEAALAAYRQADEERAEAERALAGVREELAAQSAAAGDAPARQLADTAEELTRRHAEARQLALGLHDAREALDRAEAEHQRRLAQRQEAATRAASRASLRESLDREQAALAEELAQATGGAASVAQRAAQLERQAALLTDAADAVRAAEDAARRLKDADARLADAAYRAGFTTPQDAADAALDDAAHRELQHRIDARRQEEAAVRAVLAEPETAAADLLPPADPAAAQAAADAADLRLRTAVSTRAAAEHRCAELDRLSRQSAAEARQLGPLRAEFDRVARLAGLAAGTSAQNERKMRLESYVLAARLEQVAAAATARLQRMSSGRYTLVHSDGRSGRGRSGLGLHVVDAWTGSERDTATLSGGETFFASLALALGLADVVTDEAGGVRLDTLFIDEGFGSLDDQTLDEVLDVLDSLRERDRTVGIVSHVADLRRRVHAQLEVVKGRAGSRVRQS
ncbi:SMC family ATPase [Streptomyces sp. B-S-A8]|uniref:Nuclease SbcCD subunit C n=1 Tax=Streptomyces solicavernae TaxID=3043614 RepID=A0ABT6RUE8_9ACTN|nr:SMC family ATPase [Streptomyces sp. B-S-A8]MDI3388063.1 SMC family ATPase [Streptomyces sp. B-S-A8]